MPLIIRTSSWEDYMNPAGGSWVKVLIIGNPDVGKTRSASFWPKPIFADCEDGRMSLADRKVPYGRIRSTADMDGLMTHLAFDSKRPPEKRLYQTLVIDTIDKYQKLVIGERLASEGKERLNGWADWGWLDAHMQQFVGKLLNLEMNIVVNCHYKTLTGDDDDSDKAKVFGQALRLKGDVKEWLIEEFDLVGMMESYYTSEDGQRVRKRRLRWHNEPAFSLLKDRSGSLPQFTAVDFTTADYSRVWDALMSKVDDLPEATEVDEVEVEEPVQPAGADVVGGPVDPGKLPKKAASPAAKKAAKKALGKRVAAAAEPGEAITTVKKVPTETPGEVDGASDVVNPTSPVPDEPTATELADWEKELSTDVETSDTRALVLEPKNLPHDEAEEAVARVKNELGGTEVTTDRPDKYCGKQPASHASFDAVPGCGKDLKDENVAKVNLSLLRAKTLLCADCFAQWKTAKTPA